MSITFCDCGCAAEARLFRAAQLNHHSSQVYANCELHAGPLPAVNQGGHLRDTN